MTASPQSFEQTEAPTAALTAPLAAMVADHDHRPGRPALDLGERAVVDTVAVMLAARHDPTVTRLLDAVGGDLGAGSSSVVVRGDRTDPRSAALIGGTSAHALDFDDVDDAIIGHPSAVLVPTVLAVGEQVDATGPDVLDAYWTGLMVARRLAAALGIARHYALGWHSTATVGTLAAAAAAARLRRLGALQVQHGLGIAGSLAAGSRQNFGTMTKPLHAGTAASNGVLAASLAAAGFTADPDQLERPLGFLALHSGRSHADGGRAPAATAPPLDRAALNVKLHPCCYYIHAAADATLALVGRGLSASDVRDVAVTVQPQGLAPLIHHRPRTGLQGKFSLEYALAACLLDGRLSLATFTDEQVQRPEVQQLLATVTSQTSDTPPFGPPDWDGYFAVVTVRTRDGGELTERVDRARGHADRALSESDLRAKFDDCLRFAGLGHAGDQLFPSLRSLRAAGSVRDVTGLVRESVRSHAVVGS
jgi:2-methylcitrate dehydratase PrpD